MSIEIANRLKAVKPSATLSITAKVNQMKADGADVIGLGAGEPDFDTPEFIKDAAKKALDEGKTKYTPVPGTNELKDAVISKFKRDNNLDFSRDEIIIGTGGKQNLYNILQATLNKDDEVIIPAPYWVSYPDMTLLAEGTPVIIETTEDNRFKLTADQLRKAITSKTKWLVLNSPSNPTGEVYTKDELQSLTDVVLENEHVSILVDDMYEHLIYSGEKFWTPLEVEPKLRNRIVTTNGVSKAYSMTGWRIGYAAGPAHIIKVMSKIQAQSTSNPSSISQAGATAALNGDQSFLNEWRASFKARRDMVIKMLNECDGITCMQPEGAFYVFPNCEALIGKKTPNGKVLNTDEDVVTYFLEEEGVATVHGAAFGFSPYFRISYATSEDNLKEACLRIKKACAKLKN